MKAMLDPRMVATSTQTPTRGAQGRAAGAERITPSSQGDFTKVAIVVHFLVPETGLIVSWLFSAGYLGVFRSPLYHLFPEKKPACMRGGSSCSPNASCRFQVPWAQGIGRLSLGGLPEKRWHAQRTARRTSFSRGKDPVLVRGRKTTIQRIRRQLTGTRRDKHAGALLPAGKREALPACLMGDYRFR